MKIIITLIIITVIILAVIPKNDTKIINPISYSDTYKAQNKQFSAAKPQNNCFSEQSFTIPDPIIPAVEDAQVSAAVPVVAIDADAAQKEFEEAINNQKNSDNDNKTVAVNDIDITKTLEIKPQTEDVEACICDDMPSISAFVDINQDGIDDALYISDETEEELYDPAFDINEPWFASYDITESTPQFEFAEISF